MNDNDYDRLLITVIFLSLGVLLLPDFLRILGVCLK